MALSTLTMSLSLFVQLLAFSTNLPALILLSKMVIQRESTGLVYQSHLPLNYWSYAFSAATYLINRMPSSVLGFHSPWEKVYSKPPSLHALRAFGCACLLSIP